MDSPLSQFDQVVAELLEFGEDREEMTFWKNIFPSLSASEQQELLNKLQTELTTLKNIANS